MKKVVINLFLGISVFACTLFFLINDKKRVDYGYSSMFFNANIPFQVQPKYNHEYPQSFVLLDSDSFELVGRGFRYEHSSFKIKDFLGYGYNDTSIILMCTDELNNVKYLSSYIKESSSEDESIGISFTDLSENDLKQSIANYDWVDLLDGEIEKITFYRIISCVGVVLSLFLLIWRVARKNNTQVSL